MTKDKEKELIMNKQTKALKMAVEALEDAQKCLMGHLSLEKLPYVEEINACKEALEQPAQDYVLICKKCGDELGIEYVPDEESKMTYEQGFDHGYEAHRAEQPAQEPVAWGNPKYNYAVHHEVKPGWQNEIKPAWQGLTDDEINQVCLELFETPAAQGDLEFCYAIEAKLKEKNTP
jgi:hypothetical protein